jgi:hypothetical protein
MTAILINPFRAEISGIERYLFAYDIREILGGPLERAAVLPHGDVLFVAAGCISTQGFRLAGSGPYPGYGVVIGPRGAFGEFRKARLRRSSIAEIVVFVRLDEAAKTGADVPELRNSGRAASWSEVLGRR